MEYRGDVILKIRPFEGEPPLYAIVRTERGAPTLVWGIDAWSGIWWGIRDQIAHLIGSAKERGAEVHLFFNLSERGGRSTSGGWAEVVANTDGTPPYSYDGASMAGGRHAKFLLREALVVEYGWGRGGEVGLVRYYHFDRSREIGLWPQRPVVWKFNKEGIVQVVDENLAKKFPYPEEAVQAAIAKSKEYHCRRAFFARGRVGDGPPGIRSGWKARL